MKKYRLSSIHRAAASRKPGYVAEVLAAAIRNNGEWVELTDEAAATIRREYRMRGLGDAVARVTGAVGVRPCAGCKRRQQKLNELVPFHV